MKTDGLSILLKSFNLTTAASLLGETVEKAERENWGYGQFLSYLLENEFEHRKIRKTERLLKQSKLPEGKTLSCMDANHVPTKIWRMVPSLIDGSFVDRSENILAFGLPGRGKTHFLAAIGHELIIKHNYKVQFIPTYKLVQQLLLAKQDLSLEKTLKRFDSYDVIILDDIGYVQHDRDEMEVLFTFFADRYERRSLMISSNLVFSKWEQIFKDPMTTMAAIDRLVHHSMILEFTGDSIRMKQTRKEDK